MVGKFMMTKNKKKIITSPGLVFEERVAESFTEIFDIIEMLGDENRSLIQANTILLHSLKAIKNILISKNLMCEKDFENEYTTAMNKTKDLRVSQSMSQPDQEKLYYEYIIENVSPAHS